ncbi:sensor histidine kinase [Rubeoparvulum massiliense]|uniref:sensor histidine kinase n=1 Tax=Rubeoparvulum massiliense TaxID=1631346 RepID=UPI00065E34D1|nr:sensor histidine kinase [Rubeoparvulum massiliense]
MRFQQYLHDRLAYLVFPFINIILVLTVIFLAMLEQNVWIGWGNLFYLFLLTIVLLGIVIAVDYFRLRPFYRRLNHALDSKQMGMDAILQLSDPVSEEQQAFNHVINQNYQHYIAELDRYKRSQEQHLNFTNQWVHHMKTPVSVISLLIQQGRNQQLSKEAEGLLQEIDEENERFRHGLDMMLHLARINHFALDLRAEKVELIELVRSVINEERRLFIRHQLYPKLETTLEQVIVESDPKWLAFVIHQLELNAIKYSPKGEGAPIRFVIEKKGEGILLHVEDRGIGIPQSDLPRIFDPFFTGENGRKVKESTGMGLYLSKEICRQLGHGITVESQEGVGTTITIRFQVQTTYKDLQWSTSH